MQLGNVFPERYWQYMCACWVCIYIIISGWLCRQKISSITKRKESTVKQSVTTFYCTLILASEAWQQPLLVCACLLMSVFRSPGGMSRCWSRSVTPAGSYQSRVKALRLSRNEWFPRQVISCWRKPCHLICSVPASPSPLLYSTFPPTALCTSLLIISSDTSSPPTTLLPFSA